MKKLLGIVVLGLLLGGNAYAAQDEIVFSSDKFIIVKLDNKDGSLTGGDKFTSTVFGATGWNINYQNTKIPKIAADYCKSLNKNTYLLGQGNKYFDKLLFNSANIDLDWYHTFWGGGGFNKTFVRYFCANTKDEAFNNFRQIIGTKKFKGIKKFKSVLEKKGSNIYNANILWLSNDDKAETLWVSKIQSEKEEKKIAEKPKKKKPIVSPDDNKVVPAGSGSGFIVSRDGHVITNHHVIDGCNTTKVSFQGNQVDAQILAVDKMNDIAILKTNIKPNSIFPISNEDVSLLEDVVVAGYPLGKQVSSAIKTHKGVVTALAGAGDNYSNFQTDASINAGNSGGPIMNQKGNIVGIAVATWVEEGVQGVHFGIKSSTLKTFANSNSLKFSQANNRELSNKDLGKLITEATVYLECHMTIAKIKRMIAEANNQKAFFSEFK